MAHMDHPAFVARSVHDDSVDYEFRGFVDAAYFEGSRVEFFSSSGIHRGRIISHDVAARTGIVRLGRGHTVQVGDIGRWALPEARIKSGRVLAPACDDLAGVAASLAALDRARGNAELRHLAVLLTRAEEVGLVGALHAAEARTVPTDSRIISIETSRELPDAPIGDGPIIRVGDAQTVFDNELTNRIAVGAAAAGLKHQRKLMSGGTCEASAFVLMGFRSTGLCLALGNWHNRGNLDEVEAGRGKATPKLEEISLDDFHGLIDLLLVAAVAVDQEDSRREAMTAHLEAGRRFLS